jgi:hypothetical protein
VIGDGDCPEDLPEAEGVRPEVHAAAVGEPAEVLLRLQPSPRRRNTHGRGCPARLRSRIRSGGTRVRAPVRLPATGREGDQPPWPAAGPGEVRGAGGWAELWASPQAVAWERLGWTRTVARYCRVLVESEAPHAQALVRSEARQMEDRLGLTPKAMRTPLWEIAADEVGEQREQQKSTSARGRIRAVDSAAG